MSTSPKSFLTPEQCLEIERRAEFRSEYYQGEMFAMAGLLAMAGHAGITIYWPETPLRRSMHNCDAAPVKCIGTICACALGRRSFTHTRISS